MSITVTNTRPEHIQALAELQKICFPSLSPEEWLRPEHFESHLRLFPEGQFVALAGDVPVAMSATFRYNVDFEHPQHTFYEIMGEGYFTNHEPSGSYLYGADTSVHPGYRRRGIASQLYAARKDLIRRLNLRGMVAGGMIPGYRLHRSEMSVEEYIAKVVGGELSDPTLTPQLRNGFVVRGILYNYLNDAELGNDATLIVWDNPDFRG